MADECLICGAPIEYLTEDVIMECVVCRKREPSKSRCIHGHYICSNCHTTGVDMIVSFCLQEKSTSPIDILEAMMGMPFCHMHGPEHHVLVGAALLTAYKNAGGELDLENVLLEMIRRGKQVPGGSCGFYGTCGSAVSAGIAFSLLSGTTPLSTETWGWANLLTSRVLERIGSLGGPRCCKRNSYISVLTAAEFIQEKYPVTLETADISCTRSQQNAQCIGKRCPFFC
ncbi:MAG: SAM-dependent methyltransferase [Methanocorpusculum parvum]|nr:SAM-dependent methyltransferase [Methanocorpusculum parvum]